MLKWVWSICNGKSWKKCNYVHSPEALLSEVAPAAEHLFFARRSQGHLWCHFPWFRWCILLTWFFTYCPEVEKGVAVDNSCGMSSPSSVQDSGQGTPQLKQTGMLLNQGIVQGSLTEKAQFSLGCAGSFLHHWSWHHSIILFVGLSPGFHSLCCRLNFCFFHSCFQMVEGSCLQTACRRNLQQLGTFSRWILTLQFSVSRPWTPTLKWTARQLYLTEVWETTINLNKAWSERANSHDEWRLITHYFRSLGRRPWELLTTLQPHCVCAKCLIDPITAAILHCKVASSSSTCSVSTQTIASKVKRVPPLFSNLFDLAIYSFGCQSSLHSHHKVRGNPVLEGVSVILDRMVLTSNPETKAAFEEITPTRLGNWLFLHLLYLAPVYMEVGDPR